MCIFCNNFVLTSVRNLSLLKQFIYMNLKVLITFFQKIIWFIGVWAAIHQISAIKLSKAMLTQHEFNKVLRFQILISSNSFNILRFFCWGHHKIEKMHFFWQFKYHNSGKENENYKNDPIFSSTFSALPACNIHFWIWKYLKFIFNFIILVHSGL